MIYYVRGTLYMARYITVLLQSLLKATIVSPNINVKTIAAKLLIYFLEESEVRFIYCSTNSS